MGDANRGIGGLSDEDRLPWLEAVEDEEAGEGVTAGKLIAAVIAVLVALGLVIGGVFWMRQKSAPAGRGDLISAPAGAYKQAPTANEAGSNVEGEGDATYAASQGANVSSTIDTTRIPETPVTGHKTTTAEATPPKAVTPPAPPLPKPAAPPASVAPPPVASGKVAAVTAAPSKPAAPPKPAAPKTPPRTAEVKAPPAKTAETRPADEGEKSAGGASKQIGAYSTQAKADSASADLTHRFPALRGLTLSVRTGTSNGKTVYRIFMKGAEPKVAAVCRALHSAKEGCIPG